MVFVNDLAGAQNIPMWMGHMPADVSGLTFVDVVFPAFLFIVGMAIPYAIDKRLRTDSNKIKFWQHVLLRTFGLLVLGVYMVNSSQMNNNASLISQSIWTLLLYFSAIVIWNKYPRTENKKKINIQSAARVIGVLVLILLYFLFKKGEPDSLSRMTTSWWGILGLIGWAYLVAMIFYFGTGRKLPVFLFLFSLIIVLLLRLWSVENIHGFFGWIVSQKGHVAHSLLVMSGIVTSLLLRRKDSSQMTKVSTILIWGSILLILGYFTQSFGGISKIHATPSWTFYSGGISCIVFIIVYWLVDILGIINWAKFLKPAGENPLLTYILPSIFYAVFGFNYLSEAFNIGVVGILRAILFSIFILGISSILTRKGIRMHL
jgi:predicted acyltransferase